MDRIKRLINVLLDKKARTDERDDAAMDLGEYDNDEALQALVKVATDKNEDEFIFDVCGESIAQIWVKRNNFDYETYKKLVPRSKNELYGYIKFSKPEWIKKYHLDEDDFKDHT